MGKGESDERIARYTAEELAEKRRRGESLSDWERVRNMTEEELEASIDFEEEGEFDWGVVYLARGFERIESASRQSSHSTATTTCSNGSRGTAITRRWRSAGC